MVVALAGFEPAMVESKSTAFFPLGDSAEYNLKKKGIGLVRPLPFQIQLSIPRILFRKHQ